MFRVFVSATHRGRGLTRLSRDFPSRCMISVSVASTDAESRIEAARFVNRLTLFSPVTRSIAHFRPVCLASSTRLFHTRRERTSRSALASLDLMILGTRFKCFFFVFLLIPSMYDVISRDIY